jgi:FAD/FMN-containing dehydrogenase
MIWTHHLKNITYNSSFVPEYAPPTERYNGRLCFLRSSPARAEELGPKAITLGAGVQWHEAYDAAQAQGRALVGGISVGGSVGAAGGWVLGGGHSALAPSYGLGV